MGYEIRMYVGEVTEQKRDGASWFMVRAVLEMAKPDYTGKMFALSPAGGDPLVFVFGSDGNTRITEDKYGRKLRAIPVERVIAALEEDNSMADSHYYHTNWVLGCLKTIAAAFEGDRDPINVVVFGH